MEDRTFDEKHLAELIRMLSLETSSFVEGTTRGHAWYR